jgi:hypothetical protein
VTLPKAFATRYAKLVREGAEDRPDWAASPRSRAKGRFTWYVDIRVRQDVRGDVSDIESVDAKAPPRDVTVALLQVVRSGKRKGELRPMTAKELARDFEFLVQAAVRRHGLVPAKGDAISSLRSVYRHKEA